LLVGVVAVGSVWPVLLGCVLVKTCGDGVSVEEGERSGGVERNVATLTMMMLDGLKGFTERGNLNEWRKEVTVGFKRLQIEPLK
jgi:hypothetical protein